MNSDMTSATSSTTTAQMTDLLEVDNLGKRFGGFVALENISLSVPAGERLGLIGPNGSGKSTLVNCICGTLRNEQGAVRFDGRKLDGLAAHQRTHIGLSRSFQLPRPFVSLSLIDNIRIPLIYTVGGARQPAHRARGRRSLRRPAARSRPRSQRRGICRAISPSAKCASSNWRAPWRRSRSS